MSEPTRRDILDTLLFTSLAALGLAAAAPIPFFLVPPPGVLRPKRIRLGSRKELASAGFLKGEYAGAAAIVVDVGEIRCFDATCTHRQCPVDWNREKRVFKCPCHNATFDPEGKPLSGPAKQPLAPLPFAIEGDDLFVGA